ncbi:MAG TPA: sigma-54-dependent Fis family transcriptional regulator [Polyangiaceae bacterium]|nr:sigma-54-dependent Fis family transcriptional regulator [Polyangiaceae bacterium]
MLLLDEPSARLTECFHGGQVTSHSLEEHPVLTRWARVARSGLAPDSSGYPDVTSGADLRERRDRFADIFRQQDGPLDQVAAELATRDVVTLLADPEGVIIASRGGGAFREGAGKARLIEGARWAETARGTNAIGTAAAEGTAVAVVGRAHYELRNTDLFCYATPVRDPYGDLAAVLDVSGSIAWHDPALAGAVQLAGSALEGLLRAQAFARTHAGGLPVLEKLVGRSRGPVLLAEASGSVRIANVAARTVLRVGVGGAATLPRSVGGQGGLTCEQIFGVSFEQLASMALARGGSARFEAQGLSFSAELDPLVGPNGRALALVVYLEPVAPRRSLSSVRLPVSAHPAFAPLLGTDPAFLHAKALAERFATTQLPVLLLAETGTGKELFARAIHSASAAGRGPFVALNCGALSDSLLESELFGYAPGAFTGAARTGSAGKIGAANGGTLFLDEVAEMPEALQSTLLRVLDDGVYYRVGEGRPRSSDFRLVCATSRDLPALVERGAFRRDLFYRIHGACVTIPPLRDRTDRLLLAKALLAKLQSTGGRGTDQIALAEDASLWIEQHAWPGNVRELRSALLHALALAGGGPITQEHFPAILVSDSGLNRDADRRRAPGERTKNEVLRDEYATTIAACSGNVAEAARRLGVARSTLYRTLKR